MNKKFGLRALCLAALGLAGASHAQSTDGYHIVQVLPLVVDSASFAQQIHFHTPSLVAVKVQPRFFPGAGSAQAAVGPVTCPIVTIPRNGHAEFSSLRHMCPGLVPGSAYGYVHMVSDTSGDIMMGEIPVFTAYARVSNPQGIGFGVEAFPANTFTAANAVVNGLRRTAATAMSPAFQTNCFVGQINEVAPAGTPAPVRRVNYAVYTATGIYASFVDVAPGQFVRLLDVFTTAGAPPGDYQNASIIFRAGAPTADIQPGILTMCTVQDNTSFGADFRIGKPVYGYLGRASSDALAARIALGGFDNLKGAPFPPPNDGFEGQGGDIPPGDWWNRHRVYFRHPDYIVCSLMKTNLDYTLSPITPGSGLELRLLDNRNHVVAGGNNMTTTGVIYLGDKTGSYLSTKGGVNNRYTIDVESDGTHTDETRSYRVRCASGSGSTYYLDLVDYKLPGTGF